MKRSILFVTFCLFALLGAQAQDKETKLAEIRKLYAVAKETIAKQEQEEPGMAAFCYTTEVHSKYIYPGAGWKDEVVRYYYSGEWDEGVEHFFYTPFFISRRYNVGVRDFYQEFLFDGEGRLVFFFQQTDKTNETRYYYDQNALIHEVIKGERGLDGMSALRTAQDLTAAFDKLLNTDYD